MSAWAKALREVRLYLVFLGAFLSVMVVQALMATLYLRAWTSSLPSSLAVLTGVPVFGGAPVEIHEFNLMLWSLPGIVPARWILGFANGQRPPWSKMFLAYLLAGLLVLILGDVANRRAFPIIWCELFGIAVSLSFGYVFTRRFILARPKLKPMAGEEAALG